MMYIRFLFKKLFAFYKCQEYRILCKILCVVLVIVFFFCLFKFGVLDKSTVYCENIFTPDRYPRFRAFRMRPSSFYAYGT